MLRLAVDDMVAADAWILGDFRRKHLGVGEGNDYLDGSVARDGAVFDGKRFRRIELLPKAMIIPDPPIMPRHPSILTKKSEERCPRGGDWGEGALV